MKKIYLDTIRAKVILAESYEEDGEFIYAKQGLVIRKIATSKIAYIEEDFRKERDKKEPQPSLEQPLESVTHTPYPNTPPAPVLSRAFVDSVERHKANSLKGILPEEMFDKPMPQQPKLQVIISGAANHIFPLDVPTETIESELDEKLTHLIISDDRVKAAVANLRFLKITKNKNVVEIVTEQRKPPAVNSSTIASQFANLSALAGATSVGKILPNLPLKDET